MISILQKFIENTVVVSLAATIIAVAIILFLRTLRNRQTSLKSNFNETSELTEYKTVNTSQSQQEYTPQPSRRSEVVLNTTNSIIDFAEIKRLQDLGSGNFGFVWKGMWRLQEVAVKQLNSKYFYP